MAVGIVTDSTSDLPAELARQWGITIVPCGVSFDDQVYRDGVDITSDEFFHRLRTSPKIPTTSQPVVGDFLQAYRLICESNRDVVSIHLSARLSSTLDSARQAKASLGSHVSIEIVDSWMTSMGLGLQAVEAARLAQQGASCQEIVAEVERIRQKTHVFCLLDTLEYVRKGGRVSLAQAFLASTLQIKPILTIRDGETHPVARPRTKEKAMNQMVSMVEELMPLKGLSVLHSTNPEEAENLRQRLSPLIEGEVISARFSAVMGTHLGPGSLGVALTRAD